MKVRSGATRTVFLVWRWAIKVPVLGGGWARFLQGMLANLQERYWSNQGYPQLCPVLFADPLGVVVVMPRLVTIPRPLATEDFDVLSAITSSDGFLCSLSILDNAPHNFGWLNGRIVAVDFGS